MEDILHNAPVAIVPDAEHADALGACKCDIDIGAFLGIQAAAHADVADAGAALEDGAADAGSVAEQDGVRVADAADDLVIVCGDVVEQDNFLGVLEKLFFGGRD